MRLAVPTAKGRLHAKSVLWVTALEGALMPKSIRQRVLERAVQKVGVSALSSRLQISEHALKTMLIGLADVPDAILLRAVDVVMDEEPDLNPPASENPKSTKPPT